ncbi:hypothetical protein P7G87_12270, partial [Enterococcus asini]|uniref:hypothetical protein n=1 Tax=Enterococcus asini TaxID=57732 RepID=UPI00288FFD73
NFNFTEWTFSFSTLNFYLHKIFYAIVFRVFTGYPTDKVLYSNDGKSINNLSVQLTCLEAGEDSYSKRSEMYEILKN